jgi:hypothetical protein
MPGALLWASGLIFGRSRWLRTASLCIAIALNLLFFIPILLIVASLSQTDEQYQSLMSMLGLIVVSSAAIFAVAALDFLARCLRNS